MRKFSKIWITAVFAAIVAGCTADVEDPGEVPDVDVEGGQAPAVDINPADVDISTDTQTVEVPDVDVEPANP